MKTTSKMLKMKIINGQCVGYGELMNSLNQFLLSASFMPGSPPEPESRHSRDLCFHCSNILVKRLTMKKISKIYKVLDVDKCYGGKK